MNLFNLALWFIYPSIVIALCCFIFIILPDMCESDSYNEDQDLPITLKQKVAKYIILLCAAFIVVGAVIWTVDSYQKKYYLITLLFILSPIYIFWNSNKDSSDR